MLKKQKVIKIVIPNITFSAITTFLFILLLVVSGYFLIKLSPSNSSKLADGVDDTLVFDTPTSTPTPISPSPTSTPNKNYIKTTENSDPLMDCKSTHPECYGDTIRLKSSQCNNIYCCGLSDGSWVLYSSEAECNQASKVKNTSTKSSSDTTYTYTPITYYPCTLCYHYSYGDSCQTWTTIYKTKEECDAEQARIDSSRTYTTPTVIPQPTSTPIDYVQQCKDDVNSYYQNETQQCYNLYGSSSAAQACIEIVNQEWRDALAACN